MRSRLFRSLAAGAVAAVLVAGLGTGAGARPSVSPKAVHKGRAQVFATPSGNKLLYDQNDHDSGEVVVSQNFDSPFDMFDAAAADDFTVAEGERWTVKEVVATGLYFHLDGGPADSENVTFYESALGLPGARIHTFSDVVGADNGTGSFVVDLGRGVKLPAGHYWLSVQANMSFELGGEWGWEGRLVQNRKPAAWENPSDGFGTGCVTWRRMLSCIEDYGQGPDFMFALTGKKAGAEGARGRRPPRRLEANLIAAGQTVTRVPPKLMVHVLAGRPPLAGARSPPPASKRFDH